MAVVKFLDTKDLNQYKYAIRKGLVSTTGRILKPFWEVCYRVGYNFHVECFTKEEKAAGFAKSLDEYDFVSFRRVVPAPYKGSYAHKEF
jgi:hypothetical protein